MDSVTRIKEGVIKKESFETDSFYNGLLGFPQYTRPSEIEGYEVPEVLRSGNHAKIDEYRLLKSIEKTTENRPDLMEKKLSEDEEFKKMYIKLMKKKNK
jgi:tRNA (guanine-1)-methyltransferase